ncbi:MAG: hypothetical protein WD492_13005 [Alkalispirochaeta sp.]
MSMTNKKESPTVEEIQEFLKRHELTGAAAGQLLGVDSQTIRKWTGGERPMPAASWTLLQILVGELDSDDVWKDAAILKRTVHLGDADHE